MTLSLQAVFKLPDGTVALSCSSEGAAGTQQEFTITSPLVEIPGNTRVSVRLSDGNQASTERLVSAGDSQKDKCWSKLGKLGDPLIVQILIKRQTSGLWKPTKIVVTCQLQSANMQTPSLKPVAKSAQTAAKAALSAALFAKAESIVVTEPIPSTFIQLKKGETSVARQEEEESEGESEDEESDEESYEESSEDESGAQVRGETRCQICKVWLVPGSKHGQHCGKGSAKGYTTCCNCSFDGAWPDYCKCAQCVSRSKASADGVSRPKNRASRVAQFQALLERIKNAECEKGCQRVIKVQLKARCESLSPQTLYHGLQSCFKHQLIRDHAKDLRIGVDWDGPTVEGTLEICFWSNIFDGMDNNDLQAVSNLYQAIRMYCEGLGRVPDGHRVCGTLNFADEFDVTDFLGTARSSPKRRILDRIPEKVTLGHYPFPGIAGTPRQYRAMYHCERHAGPSSRAKAGQLGGVEGGQVATGSERRVQRAAERQSLERILAKHQLALGEMAVEDLMKWKFGSG